MRKRVQHHRGVDLAGGIEANMLLLSQLHVNFAAFTVGRGYPPRNRQNTLLKPLQTYETETERQSFALFLL